MGVGQIVIWVAKMLYDASYVGGWLKTVEYRYMVGGGLKLLKNRHMIFEGFHRTDLQHTVEAIWGEVVLYVQFDRTKLTLQAFRSRDEYYNSTIWAVSIKQIKKFPPTTKLST